MYQDIASLWSLKLGHELLIASSTCYKEPQICSRSTTREVEVVEGIYQIHQGGTGSRAIGRSKSACFLLFFSDVTSCILNHISVYPYIA